MSTLEEMTAGIIRQATLHTPPDRVNGEIKWLLELYIADIFKVLRNINDTSLNEADKTQRIKDLKRQFGLPTEYLLPII